MRKLCKLLVVVVMIMTAMAAWAATTFEAGALKYEVYDETKRLVTCTGLSAAGQAQTTVSLNIPGTVTYNGTTYRVFRIGEGAFANTANTSDRVYLGWGVKLILADAFKNCTAVQSVRLPSSVQWVGNGAFVGCSNLTAVNYSSYNTYPYMNSSAWDNKGEGITLYLPRHSLMDASNFTSTNFTVDKTRNTICDFSYAGALWCVPELTSGEDYGPDTQFEAYLVDGSSALNSISLDSSSAAIPGLGFTFVFKKIVDRALAYFDNYTTIDLDKATEMEYIGFNAFFNCTGLTTLKIPRSVTQMSLPSSITGCYSLASVEINSENQTYATYEGAVYNKALTELYRVPEGKAGWMKYPSTLLEVGAASHQSCSQITGCDLPYGVKTINASAFNGTSSLVLARIPSSVTTMSNSRVFCASNPNLSIFCNIKNPPTVTVGNYFFDNSNMLLYIPYDTQSSYSDAGWTGFASINESSIQAYDFNGGNNLCYTVTSTESTTINGTTYDGRVKLVCAASTAESNHSSYNIPASVTNNGKTYAVTMIGEDAFNNITTDFTVTGCANVDTIGDFAFQNQPVTRYAFTHYLKYIGNNAFDGAGLTGTVALPYGVESIARYAFANGKYKRLVIPSSVGTIYGSFCNNTTTLKELVLNLSQYNCYHYAIWNLGTVPDNCYIRVPVGLVEHYRQNEALSSRAHRITAGAYDFVFNNYYDYNDAYFSILSTAPITYNGAPYDGTAKYVYHPNIREEYGSEKFVFERSEVDRTVVDDERNYLITEIGDSCLSGSFFTIYTELPPALTRIGDYAFYDTDLSEYNLSLPGGVTYIGDFAFRDDSLAVNNLSLPDGLTYIGKGAFYNTRLTGEIKIPSSVTTVGDFAFAYSPLSSLYFSGDMPDTFGKYIWAGPNLPNVWVPNKYAYRYNNAIRDNWTSPSQYMSALNVYINPSHSTQMFSSVIPTDLVGSGITAYYASRYDPNNPTQQLTLTPAEQVDFSTGLLLTDLVPGQEYRISRYDGDLDFMSNWLTGTPGYAMNLYDIGAFYWDAAATPPHFVQPTPDSYSDYGEAYIQVREAPDEIYTSLWPKPTLSCGDVNGDGTVDVSDVNIVINIMLGKANASDYPGNADCNGDGKVDVSDVNIIINIMLGKA